MDPANYVHDKLPKCPTALRRIGGESIIIPKASLASWQVAGGHEEEVEE